MASRRSVNDHRDCETQKSTPTFPTFMVDIGHLWHTVAAIVLSDNRYCPRRYPDRVPGRLRIVQKLGLD